MDVVVTIDGSAASSPYTIDETYTSYVDAVGEFAPRSVSVMSGSGAGSGLLQMYTCGTISEDSLKGLGRLVGESDKYVVHDDHIPEWDQGACQGVDASIGVITRSGRTK